MPKGYTHTTMNHGLRLRPFRACPRMPFLTGVCPAWRIIIRLYNFSILISLFFQIQEIRHRSNESVVLGNERIGPVPYIACQDSANLPFYLRILGSMKK